VWFSAIPALTKPEAAVKVDEAQVRREKPAGQPATKIEI
jgi:hypothetical protein